MIIYGISFNEIIYKILGHGKIKNINGIIPRYKDSMIVYNDLMVLLGGIGQHSNNILLSIIIYGIWFIVIKIINDMKMLIIII